VSALLVVQLVAVFTTGLLAGIFFGDRVGNSYARPKLPPSSLVIFQQAQNVRFARMMPLPILAAFVSNALWMVLWRSRMETETFLLVVAATAALLVAIGLTRIVNIPINDRVAKMTPASPAPELSRIWARWERVHTVRTAFALLAFACDLLALGLNV
jgi:uncharacterized membrane protein